jgi:hypothetical protein
VRLALLGALLAACGGFSIHLPSTDPLPLPADFQMPDSIGPVQAVPVDAPAPIVSATQAEATANQSIGRHGPLVGLVRRVIVNDEGKAVRGWLVVYHGVLNPCAPDAIGQDPNAAAPCEITNVVAIDDQTGTMFANFLESQPVAP